MKIPTYDAPVASEHALPVAAADQRLDMTAAQSIGATTAVTTHALETASAVYAKAKQDADLASVQDALNQQKAANEDALNTLRSAQGKNAAATSDSVYDATDKVAKTIYEGLTNDAQRRLFAQHANNELVEVRKIGDKHVRDESVKYMVSTYHNANALSYDRISSTAGDSVEAMGVLGEELAAVKTRGEAFGEAQGIDPKAEIADQQGKLVFRFAQALAASKKPEKAAALVGAYKAEVGEKAIGFLASMEEQSLNQRAENLGAEAAAFRTASGTVDVTKGHALVDERLPPGEENRKAHAALEYRANLSMEGRRQLDNEGIRTAGALYMAQSNDPRLRSVARLREESPDAWRALTAEQKRHVESWEHADKQFERNGGKPTAEQIRDFLTITDEISTQPRYATMSVDDLLNDKRVSSLPENLRLQIGHRLNELHTLRNTPAGLERTIDQRIAARAFNNGIFDQGDRKKPLAQRSQRTQANAAALEDIVRPQVEEWRRQPANVKATYVPNEVIDKFVDDAMRAGKVKAGGIWLYVPGNWYDKTTAFEASQRPEAEQQSRPFVPDRTPDELAARERARQSLIADGWKPERINDAAIEKKLATRKQ